MKSFTSHYKELARLGLPIVIGQLGIIFVSFVDTFMVGQHGTNDLAAASFVNNMFNLAIIFATGFSYGLTPIVGKLFGKGKKEEAGGMFKNALLANGTMSLLLMLAMWILYLNIENLGQPVELMGLMRPYYITLLISIPFTLLFNAFKQFADGITDTVTPMFVLLGGNLLNIFLNWVLIYGKLGAPAMGLIGAGVATLTARVAMLLVFILVFFTAKRYRPYVQGFRESRINSQDFVLLNKMGMPVGLQMGMETASFSLSTVMVGWLGTVALAAHQVMLTVGQLGFMMYYGMAAAVAVKASNFHGQNDMPAVRTTASVGFRIILVMAAMVCVPLLLFRDSVGFLFTESAEVAAMVATLVIPFVVYQFGDGLQCNYSNALRGISDVKMVSVYAFIAYFVISLPSAYLFGFVFDWGLTGIWLSFPLGLTTAGLLFYRRFRKSVR